MTKVSKNLKTSEVNKIKEEKTMNTKAVKYDFQQKMTKEERIELAKRIKEFMFDYVNKATINEEYRKKIAIVTEKIRKIEEEKDPKVEKKLQSKLLEFYQEKEKLQKEKAECIKRQQKFEKNDNDKQLIKAIKNEENLKKAINTFLLNYGIDTSGTTLINIIVKEIGKDMDIKTTVIKREKGEVRCYKPMYVLKNVYAIIYEIMLKQQVIKQVEIPQILIEKYEKKSK